MKRKIDIDNIHLEVAEFHPFSNDQFEGVVIEWDSDIGCGEYQIYRKKGTKDWFFDSECMDSNEDKRFGEKLFSLILSSAHCEYPEGKEL